MQVVPTSATYVCTWVDRRNQSVSTPPRVCACLPPAFVRCLFIRPLFGLPRAQAGLLSASTISSEAAGPQPTPHRTPGRRLLVTAGGPTASPTVGTPAPWPLQTQARPPAPPPPLQHQHHQHQQQQQHHHHYQLQDEQQQQQHRYKPPVDTPGYETRSVPVSQKHVLPSTTLPAQQSVPPPPLWQQHRRQQRQPVQPEQQLQQPPPGWPLALTLHQQLQGDSIIQRQVRMGVTLNQWVRRSRAVGRAYDTWPLAWSPPPPHSKALGYLTRTCSGDGGGRCALLRKARSPYLQTRTQPQAQPYTRTHARQRIHTTTATHTHPPPHSSTSTHAHKRVHTHTDTRTLTCTCAQHGQVRQSSAQEMAGLGSLRRLMVLVQTGRVPAGAAVVAEEEGRLAEAGLVSVPAAGGWVGASCGHCDGVLGSHGCCTGVCACECCARGLGTGCIIAIVTFLPCCVSQTHSGRGVRFVFVCCVRPSRVGGHS
jgi:hypothetical protein